MNEATGIGRRVFLRIGAATATAAAGIGVAACGEDEPQLDGPLNLGTRAQLDASIEAGGGALVVDDARGYVVPVAEADREALAAEHPDLASGISEGYVGLAHKCPHQGCRVPYCSSSGWFECPCHGSKYNEIGSHRSGPSNRGMDLIAVVRDGEQFLLDTSITSKGVQKSDVGRAEAVGPSCL